MPASPPSTARSPAQKQNFIRQITNKERAIKSQTTVEQYTTPIHLTAVATVNHDSQQGPNTVALQNPYGRAMEIHEVKFQLTCANAAFHGGTIACKLDLGNIQITNGFVPVWSFGRSSSIERPTTFASGIGGFGEFSWKFAQPLFVPPGAVLTPVFQHRGFVQQPITVRISYSGRTLPADYKAMRRMFVPWVSSWVSRAMDVVSQNALVEQDSSTETDLVNPHNTPLHLQHFVGRISGFSTTQSSGSINDDAAVGGSCFQLKMTDSRGNLIVPNLAYFHSVFSPTTKLWTCPVDIPPQTFLIATINKTPFLFGADSFLAQAHISMVGYREVKGGK